MFSNRLLSGALAAFLALPLVAPAATAPATLSVRQSGDEIVVVATAEVAADEATTWDVLTGYDRLPDFIPDMSASRTLEREGSNALVLQSGRAGFGPFKQDFSLTLAVHEVRQQEVTARAVAGDFTRFESSYRLRTDGIGHTRIEYSAHHRTKSRDSAAGRVTGDAQRDPRAIRSLAGRDRTARATARRGFGLGHRPGDRPRCVRSDANSFGDARYSIDDRRRVRNGRALPWAVTAKRCEPPWRTPPVVPSVPLVD